MPQAGRIQRGRRSRAGIAAAEKDPLRVIPPALTLWGQVDLDALRRTRWGKRLLARIPASAVKTLATMGLSPDKVGIVAMGMSFKPGKGGKDEPIMLFAVSGKLKTRALLAALKKEKGRFRRHKVAGFKVVTKEDLNLVLPSDRLVLFSSGELLKNGLSRMSRKGVKSAVEAGWGQAMLKALGARGTPGVLLAMALPVAMQKQTTAVLAQLNAGADASVKSLLIYGDVSQRGLALTVAAGCSSGGVALKLKLVLPLLIKALSAKLARPLQALLTGVRIEARGDVLALRLDLDESRIALLTALLLRAA
jgi:hypothetical protein